MLGENKDIETEYVFVSLAKGYDTTNKFRQDTSENNAAILRRSVIEVNLEASGETKTNSDDLDKSRNIVILKILYNEYIALIKEFSQKKGIIDI